jgi:uncharacterized protein Yka (UPF0111/DUF47 family)
LSGTIALKNFKGILVIGERNIFAELSQIISIAAQANTILKLMFNNMGNNQLLNENMHAIQALEKKSDVIAFGLSEDITAGAVSPNLIDNLIESTHLADNVVDIIFYLSRELDRMAKAKTLASIGRKETEWTEIYIQMLNLADQTIAKLKEMLSTAKVSNILQLHKEIEAIEEKGDDIKDAGFDTLYYMASGLHFLQFYNYSEMLHKSDDILDTCEDFSDVIVTIVTSILK